MQESIGFCERPSLSSDRDDGAKRNDFFLTDRLADVTVFQNLDGKAGLTRPVGPGGGANRRG